MRTSTISATRTYIVLRIGIFSFRTASGQIPSSNPCEEETTEAMPEHRPGSGFSLINDKNDSLNISTYATIRYLNQGGFNDTYTDYFGRTKILDKVNPEVIFVNRSPVGYLNYPTLVGATGTCFMINIELFCYVNMKTELF